MALTEKQIYNRLNRCWLDMYGKYDWEAEWYANPEDKPWIWICDIPSRNIGVRLELDMDTKVIRIEEREIVERGKFHNRYGDWERVGIYQQ